MALNAGLFASGAPRARALISFGAVVSALGVALTGSVSPDVGGPFLIAGWLGFIAGIHAFGRVGAA